MHWQVSVSNEFVQTLIVLPLSNVIVCFSRHATFFVGFTGGNDIKKLIQFSGPVLFKKKGLVQKIKSSMETLIDAHIQWTNVRKKYGKDVGESGDGECGDADSSPMEARAFAAMKRAQTTITEAKWLTILKESGEEIDKAAKLQTVLDEAMDTKRVDGSDIKGCLYEEVMRIISL